MASSSSGRERVKTTMASSRIPVALRSQLGDEATFGLIEVLDSDRKDWSEQGVSVAADRFERRLTEEITGLRLEFREAPSRGSHGGAAGARDDARRNAEVVVPVLDRPGCGDGGPPGLHAARPSALAIRHRRRATATSQRCSVLS